MVVKIKTKFGSIFKQGIARKNVVLKYLNLNETLLL